MAIIDPNDFEMVALDTAGQFGGAYIESLEIENKTDIANWTGEQWKEFISVVCGGYVSSLMDQQEQLRFAVAKLENMPLPVGENNKFPARNTVHGSLD